VVVVEAGVEALVGGLMVFESNPLAGMMLDFAGPRETGVGRDLEGAHWLLRLTAAMGLVAGGAGGAILLQKSGK
jgi:hypothetical protein